MHFISLLKLLISYLISRCFAVKINAFLPKINCEIRYTKEIENIYCTPLLTHPRSWTRGPGCAGRCPVPARYPGRGGHRRPAARPAARYRRDRWPAPHPCRGNPPPWTRLSCCLRSWCWRPGNSHQGRLCRGVKIARFWWSWCSKPAQFGNYEILCAWELYFIPFRFLLIFTMYLWAGEGGGRGGIDSIPPLQPPPPHNLDFFGPKWHSLRS